MNTTVKTLLLVFGVAVLLVYFYVLPMNTNTQNNTPTTQQDQNGVVVHPVGHASLVLRWGNATIFVDPVGGVEPYTQYPSPDVIFITDIHSDHFDQQTILAIARGNTTIIAPQVVVDELENPLDTLATVMANDDVLDTRKGISVLAVPMYNIPESPDAYHVKGRGNGYVIQKDGQRVYIAGDTGNTPEMRAMTDIDIAFVPMNLPYTMTVESAASAVLAFAPRVVYPYHYRGTEGLSDVAKFKSLVDAGEKDITVVLADWYPNQD